MDKVNNSMSTVPSPASKGMYVPGAQGMHSNPPGSPPGITSPFEEYDPHWQGCVGTIVGSGEGRVGAGVGAPEGAGVGNLLGLAVGAGVGASVGGGSVGG